MNLSELVSQQDKWEKERGIDNGNYNLDRIQVELDEAKAETNPLKVLEELIDTVIITAGGIAKACESAGIGFEQVDELLRTKLALNSRKYDLKRWFTQDRSPEDAQRVARYYWDLGFYPEEIEGNDFY